ncbi:fibrinogen-like protein 1 [Drosophila bipectinata]|uniref:fibrinogen-like protein 1 n=1 Tax=Drosophila bipectinata TaxID=42026 RepID=UPI0038B235D7
MDPRVIVVLLSVLFLSDLISANEECPANTIPEHVIEVVECSGTCFEVVKPFLSYFRELKTAADKSSELKTHLMQVLKEVEIKDQLIDTLNATIKSKDEQSQTLIKSKDEQIQTLNSLIKSNDARVRAQSDNEDLIRLKNSEISERNNEILLLNQTINKKDEEVTKLNLKVKHFEELQKNEQKKYSDEKDEFNKKLINCSEIINQNNHTLIEKENEIQQNKEDIQREDELLKEKDKKVQEKTDEAKTRDAQNSLLTSQINDLSQNLTKANKRLLECDEINSCTTAEKGIYNIKLPGVSAFEAPCNGSGWTVIQRRMDGSVDFNRNWTEYRDGFGNVTGEFFIGLEKLYHITQSSQYELLISLGKVDGSRDFVKYDNFKIGSEKNSYPLESVGNYKGGVGNSLQKHVNKRFSTYDRDNDEWKGNCAKTCGGGWWFTNCGYSSLNGRFYKDEKIKDKLFGIYWGSWHKFDYTVSLTFVEMMIRPKTF